MLNHSLNVIIVVISGENMRSIFKQDWNDDREVNALDSTIDMMLIEEFQNDNDNYLPKKNTFIRDEFIKIIGIIAICVVIIGSPIISVFCIITLGIKRAMDEGVWFLLVVTLIEFIILIKHIISKKR